MKNWRWAAGTAGLVLFLFAAWQIRAAMGGLETRRVKTEAFPITFMAPQGGLDGSRPLVLIGHGFAGSGTIMGGFGIELAQAGYAVALWDFNGHGANSSSLSRNVSPDALLENAELVLAEAQNRGLGDPDRVAILGHSMGSGVALAFGQQHPDTAATIAISPVGTRVTRELPRNLLLMAGANEPRFAANAEARLAEAGGPGGDPTQGTGRKLVIIPYVEHMSILLSTRAHDEARQWLDAVFGPQPGAQPYTDRRFGWYGLGVLGILVAVALLAPRVTPESESQGAMASPPQPVWRRAFALAGGALFATLGLWLVQRGELNLNAFLGLQVGGYLLAWFGLAGTNALLISRSPMRMPTGKEVLIGLLVFAVLWIGVGLLSGAVWLPWLLIPRRLVLWPLGSFFMLLWFLAAADAQRSSSPLGRVGWWLFQSLLVLGALIGAVRLTPALGFLMLILPVTPVLLLLHSLPTLFQPSRWVIALSGALFISWMFLAVFPLA